MDLGQQENIRCEPDSLPLVDNSRASRIGRGRVTWDWGSVQRPQHRLLRGAAHFVQTSFPRLQSQIWAGTSGLNTTVQLGELVFLGYSDALFINHPHRPTRLSL